MSPRCRLLLALAVAAFVGLRLVWAPGLLASPAGEVWGHAWVQWWHAEALPAWPDSTGPWLAQDKPWAVVDPLPTALSAVVGRLLGAVVGYDLWVLLAVALAVVGGSRLAERAGGDPVVGGVALGLAPSFLGAAASGLTEDLAVGLAALALADLGHADPRRGWRAGLWLGLLAGCGLVLAWATGLACLGLGLALAVRDRQRLRGLVPAGVVALVGAGLAALAQGDRLAGRGHRLGAVHEHAEPLWRLNPTRGVDLASFFVPGRMDPGEALVRMHPGYLGLSVVALALFAGRSRWWALAVAAVLVAPGERLRALGQPLGLCNPAAWLVDLLPFGSLVNHHGRLLVLGAVALAALAARGARRRFSDRAPWLALVVGLDLALLSPVPVPLPTASVAVPDVFARLDALPPGPLLVLPAGGPGIHPQRPLFDQRVHRRALLRDPNVPGLPLELRDAPGGDWLGSLGQPRRAPVPDGWVWPEDVVVIVVLGESVAEVESVLGTPDVVGADGAAWGRPGGG